MVQIQTIATSTTTNTIADRRLAQKATDLVERLRPAIEAHRAEGEDLRRLPTDLVRILREAGMFGLSTPHERGGFELSLAQSVELYELLGQIEGPVAWNIWNGNLGFAAAMLSEEAGDEIWQRHGDPIIANSARPSGTALATDDGFVLSGRWDIVSAVDVADWVGLFGIVMEGAGPRMLAAGVPDIRVFFLRRAQIQVLDTWHTAGMRGTGSNTVLVDGVHVAARLAISPFSPAHIDRALYRIPAFTIASIGAAPIVVGIAQAAISEVIRLAPSKQTDNGQVLAQRTHLYGRLGAAQTALDAARLLLRDATAQVDAAAAAGQPITELLRARVRAAMSHAAQTARDVLATCEQLASSTAIYSGQTIERLVRDGRVAAQHMLLSATHVDILGRLMVGLDAGTPVV